MNNQLYILWLPAMSEDFSDNESCRDKNRKTFCRVVDFIYSLSLKEISLGVKTKATHLKSNISLEIIGEDKNKQIKEKLNRADCIFKTAKNAGTTLSSLCMTLRYWDDNLNESFKVIVTFGEFGFVYIDIILDRDCKPKDLENIKDGLLEILFGGEINILNRRQQDMLSRSLLSLTRYPENFLTYYGSAESVSAESTVEHGQIYKFVKKVCFDANPLLDKIRDKDKTAYPVGSGAVKKS